MLKGLYEVLFLSWQKCFCHLFNQKTFCFDSFKGHYQMEWWCIYGYIYDIMDKFTERY